MASTYYAGSTCLPNLNEPSQIQTCEQNKSKTICLPTQKITNQAKRLRMFVIGGKCETCNVGIRFHDKAKYEAWFRLHTFGTCRKIQISTNLLSTKPHLNSLPAKEAVIHLQICGWRCLSSKIELNVCGGLEFCDECQTFGTGLPIIQYPRTIITLSTAFVHH